MKAGMESLLEVLRGQRECCAMDDAEWSAMLALAQEERVLAWTVARLRERCAHLTPERNRQLEQVERDSTVAGFYRSCELKNLLRVFHQHAIAVVPLKGPLLAERLYGSTSLRGYRDLDLLVRAADIGAAESLLAGCGFVAGEPDDYHCAWARHGAVVELHYDVENPLAFDFDVAGALRRADCASFQDEPCKQLAPEDELLYLCLHAARHRYEHLGLVLDLRLAFERLAGSSQLWNRRDSVRDSRGLVFFGLAMVRHMYPEFNPELEMEVTPKYRKQLEEAAARLWQQRMTKPDKRLDWRAVHAFFMEIERPGWPRVRRWGRHVRILSGRVIEADAIFAARFGMHGRWPAKLLRPVRLLSEAIVGRRD